jgi:hypothetical protein
VWVHDDPGLGDQVERSMLSATTTMIGIFAGRARWRCHPRDESAYLQLAQSCPETSVLFWIFRD